MDPIRRERVRQVYHAAMDVEPGRREAFLKEACAGDESMFKEMISLFPQEGNSEAFFERPALEVLAKEFVEDEARKLRPNLTGETLLHYRIGAKIGERGMGVVYRAQDTRLTAAWPSNHCPMFSLQIPSDWPASSERQGCSQHLIMQTSRRFTVWKNPTAGAFWFWNWSRERRLRSG